MHSVETCPISLMRILLTKFHRFRIIYTRGKENVLLNILARIIRMIENPFQRYGNAGGNSMEQKIPLAMIANASCICISYLVYRFTRDTNLYKINPTVSIADKETLYGQK